MAAILTDTDGRERVTNGCSGPMLAQAVVMEAPGVIRNGPIRWNDACNPRAAKISYPNARAVYQLEAKA